MSSATLRLVLVLCFFAVFQCILLADEPAKAAKIDLPAHADDYVWAKSLPPASRTLLETWLKDQSLESFLKLRQAVADSPAYDPYSKDTEDVEKLIDEQKFGEARAKLLALAPNMFIAPRYHLFLNYALQGLKDDAAQTEFRLSLLCLNGVRSTGDGSKDHPYLVLRVDDEYDLLGFLQLKDFKQALVNENGKHYDRFILKDGRELWFDVTVPFDHLTNQLKQPK